MFAIFNGYLTTELDGEIVLRDGDPCEDCMDLFGLCMKNSGVYACSFFAAAMSTALVSGWVVAYTGTAIAGPGGPLAGAIVIGAGTFGATFGAGFIYGGASLICKNNLDYCWEANECPGSGPSLIGCLEMIPIDKD